MSQHFDPSAHDAQAEPLVEDTMIGVPHGNVPCGTAVCVNPMHNPVNSTGLIAPPPPRGAMPPPRTSAPHSTRPDVASDVGSISIPSMALNGPMAGTKVVIVGSGAVGIWTATHAAYEGAQVVIISDGRLQTTATAAGWIMAYHATDPRAADWALKAMKMWDSYCRNFLPPEAIIWETTVVERARRAPVFPREFAQLPFYKPLDMTGTDMKEGFSAVTPVAPAQIWHEYLKLQLVDMPNVEFIARHIYDADEMEGLADEFRADFVVNATGIEPAFMYGNKDWDLMYGMVAHLGMPEEWTSGIRSRDLGETSYGFGLPGSTSDPYYITQRALGRVVVGGTMWPMRPDRAEMLIESDFEVDGRVVDEIVKQAEKHFPELRGLERIGAQCSIRPSRTQFLFDWDPHEPRLMHASGFGGSGITLSPLVGMRAVHYMIERRTANGC